MTEKKPKRKANKPKGTKHKLKRLKSDLPTEELIRCVLEVKPEQD